MTTTHPHGSFLKMRSMLVILVMTALMAFGARPAGWAEKLDVQGVPNLHRLHEGVYRSAQPTAAGFRELEKMGIRTVICLRGSDVDTELCRGTGLAVVHAGMWPVGISDEDLAKVLRIMCDKDRQPCLVHCLHGADRTGTLCAAYRRCIQGWSGDEAVREMTDGGFGFHSIWINLPAKVRKLDVPKIAALMKAPRDDEKTDGQP